MTDMRVNSGHREWKTIKVDEWNAKNNKANDCLSNIIMNNYGVEYGTDDYFRIEKEVMDFNESIYGKDGENGRSTIGGTDRRDAVLYDGEEFKLPELEKAPSTNNTPTTNKSPKASETANDGLKPGKFDNTKTNSRGETPEQYYNRKLGETNELSKDNGGVKVSQNNEGKVTWEYRVGAMDYSRTYNDDGSYDEVYSETKNPDKKFVYGCNEFGEHIKNVTEYKPTEPPKTNEPPKTDEPPKESAPANTDLKPSKFDNTKTNDKGQTPEEIYNESLKSLNKKFEKFGGVKVSKNDEGKIIWECQDANCTYIRTYNEDGSFLSKWSPKNNPGLVAYFEGNEFGQNVSGTKFECSKELKPDKFDNNKKNENKQTPEEYYSERLFLYNRDSANGVTVGKNSSGKITWDYELEGKKFHRTYSDDGSYKEEEVGTSNLKRYDEFGKEKAWYQFF